MQGKHNRPSTMAIQDLPLPKKNTHTFIKFMPNFLIMYKQVIESLIKVGDKLWILRNLDFDLDPEARAWKHTQYWNSITWLIYIKTLSV